MKNYIIWLTLLLPFQLMSQSYLDIKGIILDSLGRPIANAEVHNGCYGVKTLADGTWNAKVQKCCWASKINVYHKDYGSFWTGNIGDVTSFTIKFYKNRIRIWDANAPDLVSRLEERNAYQEFGTEIIYRIYQGRKIVVSSPKEFDLNVPSGYWQMTLAKTLDNFPSN